MSQISLKNPEISEKFCKNLIFVTYSLNYLLLVLSVAGVENSNSHFYRV